MAPMRCQCERAAHHLQADKTKCQHCIDMVCEGLLPGFISTNHGLLKFSKELMADEATYRAAIDVLDSCPVGAISLRPGE